jgi:PAS domain S-box-containing protein
MKFRGYGHPDRSATPRENLYVMDYLSVLRDMGEAARVLLVDDDPAVGELTAAYLSRLRESLSPTVETTPRRALDRLTAAPFDCVVSDYEMPAMDGLEFLAEVREIDPDLPFILFTGKGSEEIASEAISAGVTDYLQKETGTDQYAVLANRVENAVAKYRAQQEAVAADEQMRRLLGRITDAFFALDDDWRFQYVNERAAGFLGRDPDDLVGEDIRETFEMGVDDRFHEAYLRAMETQKPTTVVAQSSVAEGRWIEARAFPAADGLSVYGRDVTERKRMETRLREMKGKREALYDVAARAVSCTTADEIYDLAVEAAEDILEFDFCVVDAVEGDELVPQALSDPVESYYETTSLDADNLGADVYHSGESRLIADVAAEGFSSVEGSYRSALTVPLGEFGVFQAVSEDPDGFDEEDRDLAELLAAHLTEALRRIDSERALRAERDRFAALFENVPNSVVSCVYEDDEPIVQSVNPAFEETFGWDADEIVGERLDDYIVPPDARGEAEALNQQTVHGRQIRSAEISRGTTDGLRDFLLNTASVRDDGGTEDVSVYTEITEQKDRERKLARQNERLEEFASVVSHDLRNPLNVAQGRFDLLAGECDSDHLEPIGRSLDRMDSLVEDLLALARQSDPAADTERIDLTALAEEAWATAETEDANLRIDGRATVEADPARVRRLFENLFRNSVEHAGRDVSVRVGTLDGEEDGEEAGRAGFYVADDGPGIPEDDRETVFDYGFSTDERGTGLGLSIVADVADVHGWTVAVGESEAGGARFEFTVENRE